MQTLQTKLDEIPKLQKKITDTEKVWNSLGEQLEKVQIDFGIMEKDLSTLRRENESMQS